MFPAWWVDKLGNGGFHFEGRFTKNNFIAVVLHNTSSYDLPFRLAQKMTVIEL